MAEPESECPECGHPVSASLEVAARARRDLGLLSDRHQRIVIGGCLVVFVCMYGLLAKATDPPLDGPERTAYALPAILGLATLAIVSGAASFGPWFSVSRRRFLLGFGCFALVSSMFSEAIGGLMLRIM